MFERSQLGQVAQNRRDAGRALVCMIPRYIAAGDLSKRSKSRTREGGGSIYIYIYIFIYIYIYIYFSYMERERE